MKIELREKEKTHEEIEEILRKKKFEHFNCGPMPQPHPVPSYPEPPKDGQYPLPGQYYPPMPGPMPMPYPDGSMPDNEYPKPEGGNVESQ